MTWLTFLDILTIVIQVQELEEREAVTLDLLINNSYMYLYDGTMPNGM